FNFNQLDFRVWMLLGEAKSKCEHISGAPLLPETIADFHRIFLAKGALATTAIEGNTLSEDEVNKRISGKLELPPSKEYLGQEIDNIVTAFNLVNKKITKSLDTSRLTLDSIYEYNRIILDKLTFDEGVVPGELRTYNVRVATYRAAPAEDCRFLIEKYVNWLNEDFNFEEKDKIVYGILKAIVAHLYFVWIHPFGDGNGRTARLIEFQILRSVGIPSAAAHLLSNHFNATRTRYYQMLDKTSKVDGSVYEFIHYALAGLVDQLKEQIDSIQGQQVKVHWINHIFNTFRGQHSKKDERQRDLMLELSIEVEFQYKEIKQLTPKIALMYANLTDLTLRRDLDELVKIGLLVNKGSTYVHNVGILSLGLAQD
ncbi:MAG: Fic family protein, partial [Bellilinea sp.]